MTKYCKNVYANENIDECKIDYLIEHNGKWLPFDHTTGFNYCPWCGKKIKKYIPKVIRIKKKKVRKMLVRVEDLCHSCKHFDIGNYECKKDYFLDGESEKFTIECDSYEEGAPNER